MWEWWCAVCLVTAVSYPCSWDPHSSGKWYCEFTGIGESLCWERKKHWRGSGWGSHSAMSWLSNLGWVTLSPWASSGQWSTRLSCPRGLSSLGSPPPLFLQSLSEWTGVDLCLISTGSQRAGQGGSTSIRLQACIDFTWMPCLWSSFVLFLFLAHSF